MNMKQAHENVLTHYKLYEYKASSLECVNTL